MVTSEQLKNEYEVLTLESLNLSSLSFLQRLPIFANNVSQFVSGLFKTEIKGALGYVPNKRVLELMETRPFADFHDLIVIKPAGLQKDYITYQAALIQTDQLVATLITECLAKYRLWLGSMLNTPDELLSLRNAKITGDIRFAAREKAAKELSKCFNMNKMTDKTTLADLCPRSKDWVEITSTTVLLDKTLGIVSRDIVETEISNISSILTSLINYIETEKKEGREGAKPQTIKCIADVTYAIATECEYYAAYYYRMLTLVNSVKNAEEAILKSVQ